MNNGMLHVGIYYIIYLDEIYNSIFVFVFLFLSNDCIESMKNQHPDPKGQENLKHHH